MNYQIRVDQLRMKKLLTVNELIGLQEGDVKTVRDVMAKFIMDESQEWLSIEEGKDVVGNMTLEQLEEATSAFIRKAEDIAVPPANGAV